MQGSGQMTDSLERILVFFAIYIILFKRKLVC